LIEVLDRRAASTPDDLAFTYLDFEVRPGERTLSYAQLAAGTRAVAARLADHVTSGERALLLYPPGLDYIVAFLGCLRAGVIAVPAYPPDLARLARTLPRLRAIAADAEIGVVLTTRPIAGLADAMLAQAPELARARWLPTDGLDATEGLSWRDRPANPRAPAFLQYTSGSTSSPRGVVLSHDNLMANQVMIQARFGHRAGDVVAGWLPLYHDMGLIGNVLQPLYLGLQCVLMAPHAFLQRPTRWLETITRFRATTSGGPNFAYDLCVRKVADDELEALDLSCWRVAFNGAEPIRAATLARFADRFAPCGFRREAFFPCYGLAEATLLVTGGPAGRVPVERTIDRAALAEGRIAAPRTSAQTLIGCGSAAAGVELRIVDPEQRRACVEGQVGEIWLRGPSIAAGYHAQPEQTLATFAGRLVDEPSDAPTWLRTGDLGYCEDSELFVTGRRKDLIIVRGRNIYPQDVEATVEACHGALRPGSSAAFMLDADAAGVERVCVCVELHARRPADHDEVIAAIRAAVLDEHELALASVVLLRAGGLPKTSSGKVQRHACRNELLAGSLPQLAASQQGGDARDAAALDGELLELARLVAPHLECAPDSLDPRRSLAALGLDSLSAVEIVAALERSCGLALPLATLLAGPSLEQLAALLREHAAAQPRPTHDRAPARDDEAPSAGVHALWILHRLDPTSSAYNLAGAVELAGTIVPARVHEALQRLADRHAALRTCFPAHEGRPHRRVAPQGSPVAFVLEQAAELDAHELQRRLDAAAHAPFDLEHGPLFRASLWQREDDSLLLIALHHAIADLHGLARFVDELGTIHAALARGVEPQLDELVDAPEPPLAPDEVEALWQRWQAALRPPLPSLALPSDAPGRGSSAEPAARHFVWLDTATWQALQGLAARAETTPFVVLLAIQQVMLARLSASPEFAVGVPSSGTSHAQALGYRVRTLPIRADLRDRPTFLALVDRVKHTLLAAIADRALPLATMVERLNPERELGRTPLVQTLLTMHHTREPGLDALALGLGGAPLRCGDLEARTHALAPMAAQFELRVSLAEHEGRLAAAFEVPAEAWTPDSLARLGERWLTLVHAALREPELRVDELALVGPVETATLARFNATRETLAIRWLHEATAAQAAAAPDAIAVRAEGGTLTRAALQGEARRLAHHLHALGVGPDVCVGVELERGLDLIVALLAVLEAGGAYVPLDPDYPRARLQHMAEDAGIRVLIGAGKGPRLDLPALVHVDMREREIWSQAPTSPLDVSLRGEHLAYVIYTSGSTGRPKGAMNSHAGIANRLAWAQTFDALAHDDIVLQKTPSSFDVSVWELFWPLWSGAELVFARPGGHLDPAYLSTLIRERAVTTLHFVPSMLQVFLDQPERPALPSLRRVICSGEALPADLRDRALRELGVPLFNLYGPAETAIEVSAWPCVADEGPLVPIGRPIANVCTYVLDDGLREAPIGTSGELYLGGVAVGRGYVGQPGLTAERFVPNPRDPSGARIYRTGDLARWRHDGVLEFLGRADQQVKIRGVRIELGEIETCLRAYPGVRDAVVSIDEDRGHRHLVAWLVVDARLPAPELLRSHLAERMPDAMIPALFVAIDAIPRSLSGKVDRRQLPAPPRLRSDEARGRRAPASDVEQQLALVWAQTLGVAQVGVDDDFFALGGDSISAMQVVAAAARVGLHVEPRQLFAHPTIAGLATCVRQTASIGTSAAAVGETLPLGPMQRWLLEGDSRVPTHCHQALLVELVEHATCERVAAALAHLVERHEALRLEFVAGEHGWQQRVGACRPVELRRVELAHEAELDALATSLHEPFSLSAAPLLRGAWIVGFDRPRLALVAHHLVVDGVSWRVLLTELASLLRGHALSGTPPTPYSSWLRVLDTWARSDAAEASARTWLSMPASPAYARSGPTRRRTSTIDGAVVQGWLDACARAATTLDELLLATLAGMLVERTNAASCTIDVESHGRAGPGEALALSGSVGWFTALAPLCVALAPGCSRVEALARTREALRARPAPESLAALACFDVVPERRAALRARAPAWLCFNHLGSIELGSPDMRVLDPAFGPLRTADEGPSHMLTLDLVRSKDTLHLSWRADATIDAEELAAFERQLVRGASELAEQLASEGLEHPLAAANDLDADELAMVLAQLR
jgi:amino acid adenylation domain-containing protein